MNRYFHQGLLLPIACLCMLASGCIINPVPTPGSAMASKSEDNTRTGSGQAAHDAGAGATGASDAALVADTLEPPAGLSDTATSDAGVAVPADDANADAQLPDGATSTDAVDASAQVTADAGS